MPNRQEQAIESLKTKQKELAEKLDNFIENYEYPAKAFWKWAWRNKKAIAVRKDTSPRRNQAQHRDSCVALKCSIAQFWCSSAVFPSDCLPDVLPQVFECAEFAGECPRSVRVFEARQHAN